MNAPMWRRYLRFLGPDVDADVEDELRFHLETREEELVRAGAAPEAARAQALREFGDVARVREECRVEGRKLERTRRWRVWWDELLRDVLFSARQLRRNPGFALMAVATLGLGIGGSTAMFSLVNGILLRPLPFAEPGRLVDVRAGMGSPGEYLAIREAIKSFAGVGTYNDHEEYSLTGRSDPLRVGGAEVSAGLFGLLGARPELGRGFTADDELPGAAVMLLSHGLWRQRFGGDPSIVGSRVVVDGQPRTVVGVMPAGFGFPARGTALWLPVTLQGMDPLKLWYSGGYSVVARLRPGRTPAAAQRELRGLETRVREARPGRMPDDYWRDARVSPLREVMVGSAKPALLVLFAAVTLMLLIACLNVATLLLVRETARRRELAVRSSLGAARKRLVRQLLTESLLLAGAGMVVGLGGAIAGVRLLRAGLPADTPRLADVAVDARVLAFAVGATLLTALVFGAVPALRATGSLQGALRDGDRGGTGTRPRLTSSLVVGELALAVTLVTGAGLLVRSLWQLQHIDPGFRAENLVTLEVSPSEARFPGVGEQREFFRRLLERARSLPESRVSVTSRLPFGRSGYMNAFLIAGRPDPATVGGDFPLADVVAVVDTGYLHTMGVSLLRGRGLEAEDGPDAPGTVLASESLARKYWPEGAVLGARVTLAGEQPRQRTVVGVVADSKWASLSEDRRGAFYVPLAQGGLGPTAALVVRTSRGPEAVAGELRGMVRELDPDAPVSEVRTMDQLIDESVARPRLTALLLAGFAAVAMLLGVLGIYGVVSYSVRQRARKFGVRIALGASPAGVVGAVIGQGLLLALCGVTLGLVAAAAGTGLLRAFLVGVGARDPLVFGLVPVVLLIAALLGTLLPARRATRVDPMIVMRGS